MPQRPNTTGALGTELDSNNLTVVWIIRLDITNDPLFAWTGFGDLTFAAGATGDTALDGQTFQGITHLIAEVGAVQDQQGGSTALEISVPGISLTDEAMRQVVYDRRVWQFKTAYAWLAFLDDNDNVIGNPVRVKSGRMDQMLVEESEDGTGVIRCVIEGQQAYSAEASGSRYSEQEELDPTDTSQKYVWALANMDPKTGSNNIIPGTPGWGAGVTDDPGVRGFDGSMIGW